MTGKRLSESEKLNIVHLYHKDELTIKEISLKLHRSKRTVSNYLKRKNIKQRSQSELQRRFPINETFFENINSENQSYWLGFIYADGCIYKNSLSISLKDKEHLEIFKDLISPTRTLTTYKKYVRLEIKSKLLSDSLKNLGVVERKTFTLNKLPNIPNNLLRHFIRGYFDGDGSLSYYKTKRSAKACFSILGTSSFLEDLQKVLEKECNLTSTNLMKIKGKNVYRYSKTSKIQIMSIYDYFYKDSNIYLQRKKIKFEELRPFIQK